MERHSCTANVITQYTDALTSRPNGLGSSGKDKKMTGQVLCQNFKCLVMRQKRPVMTDDRTLFPTLLTMLCYNYSHQKRGFLGDFFTNKPSDSQKYDNYAKTMDYLLEELLSYQYIYILIIVEHSGSLGN